jgi:hypothetical protein
VVGALGDDVGANFDQGSAYAFTRTGSTWSEQAKLTASDGAIGDSFGSSVAVSADTAVVGAFFDTVGANAAQGSAYAFTRTGSTWSQQAKLTASNGAASDQFGSSVAVDGDTAVVGARQDDVGANAFQGSAYVFTGLSGPGPPATLDLAPAFTTNDVSTQHCMTATVKDTSLNPTPNITVRFTVTGSVNTSGSATTNTSGAAQFCYQGPELPGADQISAFADTDEDGTQDAGEPSDMAAKTWVLPVSTPLCEAKITGGRITANNGDKASFRGNAQVSATGIPGGQEFYRDRGPAQPQTVKSTMILAVTCNQSLTQASIFGKATIDGSGSHHFKIEVQDLGEPGVGKDTYRILLDTGYDSGVHKLEGGNVEIHKG